MKIWSLLLFAVAAGCQPHNPKQVWIDMDGSEAALKLSDSEPDPF
jgi:hypothetical protein